MTQKEYIESTLTQLLNLINISPSVELTEEEECLNIVLRGDNLNFLIGMHGMSLQAVETFLNIASYRRFQEGKHVCVDINDYKVQKKEKIQDIAKRGIDKVRFFSEDVVLPPMTASERRYVHTFVSEYDDVITESIGDEPMRRVVLKKKAI
jgi:spoIIIJ-associated protein